VGPGSILLYGAALARALAAPAAPGALTATLTGTPAPVTTPAALSATLAGAPPAVQAAEPSGVPSPDSAGPPPPEALVAIGADKFVSLSWLPSPAGTILGYNVYRSTEEASYGSVPVNRSLVTGTEFIDNQENSTSGADNGTTYYYMVRAVDAEGRLSIPSEGARARPEGAPVISEIPKVDYGFGESQLSVSGRKVVSLGYTIRTPKNTPGVSQLSGSQSQRLDLQQQLQVRLNGTVGKKISVDVDYDDTAPDQTRQRLSVVYAGDPQEVFQRAEFGDIRLQLSDTEFTGYDKQLFGVRLQTRLTEKLRATIIATQTQGINASETFVGQNQRQEAVLYDNAYVSNKYFYISNPNTVRAHGGIKPGSELIYLDDNVKATNGPTTILGVGSHDFDRLYQGVDYSIDYDTGIINFILPNRSISGQTTIAVAFDYVDNVEVAFAAGHGQSISAADAGSMHSNWDITASAWPFDPLATAWGDTTPNSHLILDGPGTGLGDAHMVTNWYQLGYRNIVPKDFDAGFIIKVVDSSGNEVTGIIAPVLDSDFYDFGILKIRNDPSNCQRNALQPGCPVVVNPPCPTQTSTNAACPAIPPIQEQPFAYNNDAGNSFYGPGNNAYSYGTSSKFSSPRYVVKVDFLTRISSYHLKNINVVRGSEHITLDGRILSRDVDYFIDYDFGQVTFLRPEQIKFDSRIQVDYEYLPFGGQFQSLLYGGRAQYVVSDKSSLGATYLSNQAQAPQDAPSPTAAPKSTSIAGVDGHTFLSRQDLSSVVRILPGFEKTVLPLEMEVRGEAARSDINPNIYTQPGVNEQGVAMIDNMEGVDDIISAGPEAATWFPASVPQDFDASGMTIQTRTAQLSWNTGQGRDTVSLARTLDLDYRGLTTSADWDGLRYVLSPTGIDMTNYQYLELWVHGGDNIVDLSVDLGVFNEDTNGNGKLDTEDANGDGLLNAGEDTGIPPTTGFSGAKTNPAYWGGAGTLARPGWPGPGGTVLNTEDMNGNGVLESTDHYFEYRIHVDWGNAWKHVKIPLNFDQPTNTVIPTTLSDGSGKDVNFYKTDGANKTVVKQMRVWLRNGGASSSGQIRINDLGVTGNRWQLRTTPNSGVLPDPGRFNVSAISKSIAAEYSPLLSFFVVRATGDELNEASLKIEYNLFDAYAGQDAQGRNQWGLYYASRSFPTPINLLDYQELRFDIYKENVASNGEFLFLRAGGDEINYFQFTVPLDNIGPGWQTVTINLRDDRNRLRVGTPTLSGARQFSFGLVRYDPQAANVTESVYINNLRLTTPQHKVGIARKVNVRMSTPMGSTYLIDPNQEILPANAGIIVDTTYRELDNDFRLIDQPTFLGNDQHHRTYTSVAQIRRIPKLPITLNVNHDDSFVEAQHRDDPVYFFAPDRIADAYTLNMTSDHLAPISLGVAANRNEETVHFLTGVAGADYARVNWSANPTARAPLDGTLMRIPLGSGGEVSGSARYTKDRWNYEPTTYFANIVDRTNETLDEQYVAHTTYKPFAFLKKIFPMASGLSTAPRAQYTLSRTRGIIGSIQVVNVANPNSIVSQHRFQPVTQEISAGLDNRLDSLKGLTPSVNYAGDARRDFTLRNLTTTSRLTSTLDLRPGDWVKVLNDQSFNLGYTIETGAQYYDITQIVGGVQQTVSSIIDSVPQRDIWGVNRKNDLLSTSNSYSQTYIAGGRLVFWQTIAASPNYNFRQDTRLAQSLRTRTTSTNAGTGLSLMRGELMDKAFKLTPLFWMHPAGPEVNYSYRKATTFDFKDQPTQITEGHNVTGLLPFTPVKNMTGSLTYNADIAVSHYPVQLIKTVTRSQRPGVQLGYTRNAGLEFPLIWWRIKLSNLFTIRHTFTMNFIDNVAVGQLTGTKKAQEIQDFTEFEYEMLKGISLRFRAQFDKVANQTTPLENFKAYSLFGTFLFNF